MNKTELENIAKNVLEAVHIQMTVNNHKAMDLAMQLYEESIDIEEFNANMHYISNMDDFLDTIHSLVVITPK